MRSTGCACAPGCQLRAGTGRAPLSSPSTWPRARRATPIYGRLMGTRAGRRRRSGQPSPAQRPGLRPVAHPGLDLSAAKPAPAAAAAQQAADSWSRDLDHRGRSWGRRRPPWPPSPRDLAAAQDPRGGITGDAGAANDLALLDAAMGRPAGQGGRPDPGRRGGAWPSPTPRPARRVQNAATLFAALAARRWARPGARRTGQVRGREAGRRPAAAASPLDLAGA